MGRERVVSVVRTRRKVRDRYYDDLYVKVKLPKWLVEKLRIVAYRVCLDEETGRIVLEPIYAGEDRG